MATEQAPPKHCPLLKDACKQDNCVFWISCEESVARNCAVVIMAQQLDILAVKGSTRRLS